MLLELATVLIAFDLLANKVFLAGLEALMPRLEQMPIKVALEPHYRTQFQEAADYDYIFDRIDHPQVGITIDIGHFHSAQVDTRIRSQALQESGTSI
jgi:sugar phosphate isomerase/epimerase